MFSPQLGNCLHFIGQNTSAYRVTLRLTKKIVLEKRVELRVNYKNVLNIFERSGVFGPNVKYVDLIQLFEQNSVKKDNILITMYKDPENVHVQLGYRDKISVKAVYSFKSLSGTQINK